MSQFHDDSTAASNPGGLRLAPLRLAAWPRSKSLFRRIAVWLFSDMFAERIDEHLQLGDSRAAVVISLSPLLVAAYTDELDCVAVLEFPGGFAEQFALNVGTRLLTINTYAALPVVAPDLLPGAGNLHRWQNFHPVIAEFLSEDLDLIVQRKAQISDAEWDRCLLLGREYAGIRPGIARDGSPFESFRPAGAA